LAKKNAGKRTAEANNSPMNVSLLEQITRLMRDNDLNTVDVRDGDKRVILKRGAVVAPNASSGMMYAAPQAMHHAPAGNPGLPSPANTGSGGSVPAMTETDAGLLPIKSPMVGTFYTASSPDAKPMVSVGSEVDEETDVCIIEAMKVFNNIKAEMRGTISKILVSNGQTVEFGQPLFLVKPS
jgi:acetyl-CoA carboxylase biotin carboxyl carrier protein